MGAGTAQKFVRQASMKLQTASLYQLDWKSAFFAMRAKPNARGKRFKSLEGCRFANVCAPEDNSCERFSLANLNKSNNEQKNSHAYTTIRNPFVSNQIGAYTRPEKMLFVVKRGGRLPRLITN